MSQRRDDHQASSPKLDVKMNLSPTPPLPLPLQPDSPEPESPTSSASSSSSEMSIDGSCVSSEAEQDQSSSIRVSPMVLVGCPRCLMYVMLSDTNSKCPICKSTVLLDFLNEETNKKTGTQ